MYLRCLYVCSYCSFIIKMEHVIFGCECQCYGAVGTLQQILLQLMVFLLHVSFILTNRYT